MRSATYKRLLLPVMAAALLLGVLAAGVLAYDASREDWIAEGVAVGGVDVGGRRAAEAREVVRERVKAPVEEPVTVRRGGRDFQLGPQRAELEVDVEATVDAALEQSRGGTAISRTLRALSGGTVEADVEPRVGWSEQAVDRFVEEVAGALDREPRDATLEPSGAGLDTTRARDGFTTDRDALRSRVERALQRRRERVVTAPGEATEPEVTLSDLAERHPVYVTIDRDATRLHYYEDLERVETYRIGVGRAGHETPAGLYDVSSKATNPTWYVPDEPWAGEQRGEVIPPGPENPIKSRWLGIEDGVGIHGTDEPESIGSNASHGCIRMLIPDVKELYGNVPVGTAVYIA